MSDFDSITPYGSKVCHGSVTGVTCDTTVTGCDRWDSICLVIGRTSYTQLSLSHSLIPRLLSCVRFRTSSMGGLTSPSTLVIIPLHVICCLFECSLHLLLGMIQSPHKGVHSLHCQHPHRLYSQAWVLTGVKLKGGPTCCHMDLVVVCELC